MSKKVWNSCKRFRTCFGMTAVKSLGMAMCVFVMLNSFQHLFAQTKSTSGTASTGISMPEMPSVSMPSVGSGFYTPGRSDFYNPNLNRSQTSSQNTNSTSSAQESASQTSSSSSSNTQTQATTNAQNLNKIANSATSSLSQLTADDISSLSNLGVFSQISSLLGKGNSHLLNQNTVSANTSDSATLQAILSELTSLKNQIQASSEGESIANLSDQVNAKDSFSNIAKKEPKILRFNVNGYDLLTTCKKIYFSELETDGTFLLTGDRKYMSEGKTTVRGLETLVKRYHIKLLIIDGLSYITATGRYGNESLKYKDICNDLFRLSKTHRCAVVAAVQANRESRENKDENGEVFPNIYNISESDHPARIATQVFSMRQLYEQHVMEIRLEKSRNARNERPTLAYSIDFNTGSMEFIANRASETSGSEQEFRTPIVTTHITQNLEAEPIVEDGDDDEYSDVEF